MNTLLSVSNLSKSFATRHGKLRAVDSVSFTVARGETVALVGESGCGKSTVAMALLNLLTPDHGDIHFASDPATAARRHDIRSLDVGIVFQNPYSSLDPKMRIIDIVGEALRVQQGLKGDALRDRVVENLENVGLDGRHLKRFPHEFSGGQRQRIAIARALTVDPELLVLDEPTSSLDVSVQAQVLNLLKRLQRDKGLSYLFITHNLATAQFMADRVLVMYLGKIVEAGPVTSVFEEPDHPYTRALLDSVPSLDPASRGAIKVIPGDVPSPLNLPAGCAFRSRCEHVLEQCGRERPRLVEAEHGHFHACFNPLASRVLQ